MLSLIFAAELAADAVEDAQSAVDSTYVVLLNAVAWQIKVETPGFALKPATIALSGWSMGVACILIGDWSCALLSLPFAAAMFFSEQAFLVEKAAVMICVSCAVVAPLGIVVAPATVSTACVHLLESINDILARDSAFVVQDGARQERNFRRVDRLVQYYDRVNHQRGLGFVVFGTVITIESIKKMVGAIGTAASGLAVYLIHIGEGNAAFFDAVQSTNST